MTAPPQPVLVVGAGPVGLAAALALRARGLPATVLEADPADRVRPGSRALYVHGETLHRLERIAPGLGGELARHGLVWHTRSTRYAGREVFRRSYPPRHRGGLPPFTSLRQVDTERLLRDAAKRQDVRIHWDATVETIHVDPDEIRLTTADGATFRAGHVIAADGARSAIRRALGIPIVGHRSPRFHVVVDVEQDPDHPYPAERIFHYHHPGMNGRHVLVIPFAGGVQVDLQCLAGDTEETIATPDRVRHWLPRVLDPGATDRILWVSHYHFQQRVAPAFTDPHRRVLLAGEAAHLFAPFGARGMNSGIADADEAAAAVAAALADPAGAAAAVERYDTTRRGAAERNRTAAGRALAHQQAGPVGRLRQRLAAAVAPLAPAAGRWLDEAPYGPRRTGPSGRY
ncbi:FAD-dependent monooxygenase [Micromonospora fulviviridis]